MAGKLITPASRFTAASTDPVCRIIGSSKGDAGSGKTSFWLSAPEPIYVHLSDPAGLEGVLARWAAHKDVRVVSYNLDLRAKKAKSEIAKAAVDTWDQFTEDFTYSLANARTIVWDKEDYFWEVIRLARFAGDQSNRPNEYQELYLEYRTLIYKAFGAGVNFGLIRGMKEKWDQKPKPGDPTKMIGVPSGVMIPRGMKEVPELAQIDLQHSWNKDEGYVLEIGKCRVGGRGELRGLQFFNDQISFAQLGVLLVDNTSEEDWQ